LVAGTSGDGDRKLLVPESDPGETGAGCCRNQEELDSIPRCSIFIRSYNLRRILIALGAVIAEMAFPGQVRTDISRNDHHPQVRLHVIRYLPS
jgi:hypothetical protein